jgi:deazaflavin-dependent oxidoreductase (nitroreductase family)
VTTNRRPFELAVRTPANALTMWALLLGIPRPPYTRRNALVVETIGRQSGKRRRLPVGFVESDGKFVVVAENGERADWVRNALRDDGRLRVHFRGKWRDARLRLLDEEPELYLQRMNKVHAAFVRRHSVHPPAAVEITIA